MMTPIVQQPLETELRPTLSTTVPRFADEQPASSPARRGFFFLGVLVAIAATAFVPIDSSLWLIRQVAETARQLGFHFAETLVGCFGLVAAFWAALFMLVGFCAGQIVLARPRSADGGPRAATGRENSFVSRTVLPALTLALAADVCLLGLFLRALPAVGDLLPAGAVSLFGVGLALAGKHGWRGRARYCVLAGTLGCFGLVVGLFLVSDVVATVCDSPQMTERARSRLRREIKRITKPGHDPVRVVLTQDDLNLLAARWLDSSTGTARVRLTLDENGLLARASLDSPPLWIGKRYLNLDVRLNERPVSSGPDRLAISEIRVGDVAVPSTWTRAALGIVNAALCCRWSGEGFLNAVADWRLGPQSIELTVNPGEANAAALSPLEARLGSDERFAHSVREYRELLSAAVKSAPAGDGRFLFLLKAVFAAAHERTARSADAAQENRAALTAFGIFVGNPNLISMAGLDSPHADHDEPELGKRFPGEKEPVPEKDWGVEKERGGQKGLARDKRSARLKKFTRATLLGRNDWARHFATSAALNVLASESVGRAAGLLKEEWDSGKGGSGFSFADLMADEAGLRFATAATRDEASAASVQQRLSSSTVEIHDLFPGAEGLPEGVSAARLRDQFGGVGGPGYRRIDEEIRRRLATCALLQ